MLPSKIIELYPDNIDVLNIFTDYHWKYNNKGPFKVLEYYYLGEIRFDINHPLYLPAIINAIQYFEKVYKYAYNSSEKNYIYQQIKSLKCIREILYVFYK